jgi:esterase/lipase superfamily enzyme
MMPEVMITAHFGTNRNTAPGGVGTGFRVPTDADKRLYVTGTVQVSKNGDVYAMDPTTIKIDPDHDSMIAGTATLSGIADQPEVAANPQFADFAKSLPKKGKASPKDAGLFYVHGFNNTFASAMESAARIFVGYDCESHLLLMAVSRYYESCGLSCGS